MYGRSAAAGGLINGPLAGRTILLVEDEPDLRDLLAETLTHHGANVCASATAEDALAALDGIAADALVADIGLPGIDGLELVRLLRARGERRGGKMPAVALTGYTRSEDRDEAIDAGFQRHLTKPIDGAQLVATLADLIRHSVR
jgi:CheY-like chemotaxis protein